MNSKPAPPDTHAIPGSARPAPIQVGDHLALDFLNTIATPKDAAIEWIGAGRDLIDWLSAAGALTQQEAEQLAARWPVAVLDQVAAEARSLREWFRGVVRRLKHSGRTGLSADDIERLNALLALDCPIRHLEASGAGEIQIVSRRAFSEPRELLAPLVAAMAELVAHGDFDLVRPCESKTCTLWFYDRTKGHRRRWCSQAVCGNRAKVAAFRERRRSGG